MQTFLEWMSSRYLYHGTQGPLKNDIIRLGLLQHSGVKTWDNPEDGVFLTQKPYRAFEWVKLAYQNNHNLEFDRATIALFQVDVSGLDPKKMVKDTVGTTGDWRYLGDIPPQFVRFVREIDVTDELPNA